MIWSTLAVFCVRDNVCGENRINQNQDLQDLRNLQDWEMKSEASALLFLELVSFILGWCLNNLSGVCYFRKLA